ncbi:DUF6123 family protein [Bacillus sp. CGMCC 1.16607]|uniref:DUF6123 family protein n=1 Tax=Bacillus sp. CGMCC 1.16607 TaxID=3351842 RepID=UPI00362F2E37
MGKIINQLEDFLANLQAKGFHLQEDAIGFIYFGKHFTNAPDDVIITAIEFTLKTQKEFDGSFYISLLETLTVQKVQTREEAIRYIREIELI